MGASSLGIQINKYMYMYVKKYTRAAYCCVSISWVEFLVGLSPLVYEVDENTFFSLCPSGIADPL